MIYTDGDIDFSNTNECCHIPVFKGDNFYIERWWISEVGGDAISFAYTEEELPLLYTARQIFFDSNGVNPTFMKSYTVPADTYEKIKQKFNLTD